MDVQADRGLRWLQSQTQLWLAGYGLKVINVSWNCIRNEHKYKINSNKVVYFVSFLLYDVFRNNNFDIKSVLRDSDWFDSGGSFR